MNNHNLPAARLEFFHALECARYDGFLTETELTNAILEANITGDYGEAPKRVSSSAWKAAERYDENLRIFIERGNFGTPSYEVFCIIPHPMIAGNGIRDRELMKARAKIVLQAIGGFLGEDIRK